MPTALVVCGIFPIVCRTAFRVTDHYPIFFSQGHTITFIFIQMGIQVNAPTLDLI